MSVTPNLSLIPVKKKIGPTIDGDPSDAVWLLDRSIAKPASGTLNNTASFGLLWDDAYLYIGVSMKDAAIFTNQANNYLNDGVEIYFDTDNNGGTPSATDRQFILVVGAAAWEKGNNTAGVKYASKTTATGYGIELAVPWAILGGKPALGKLVGFDIGYNDSDNTQGRTSQALWMGTGDNYLITDKYGDFMLVDAPAPAQQEISLKEGWNIISFTVLPADMSIAAVFSSVMSQIESIKNMDVAYIPSQAAYLQGLSAITAGQAYMVKMKSPAVLRISGTPIEPSPIVLGASKEWQLVASTAPAPVVIDQAFDLSKVLSIKSSQGEWMPAGGTLTSVTGGQGYFVKLK